MLDSMFNSKSITEFCENIVPTNIQKQHAQTWLRLLENDKLVSEDENSLNFADIILQGILGYDRNQIKPEKNRVDYQIMDSKNNSIICLERKGTAKDLTKLQSSYPEEKKTPIRQTWDYQSKNNSKYGICTNHRIFMLLDKDFMLTKMHEFDFQTIKNNPDKLKEFIGVFSKNRLIDNNVKELYERSEKVQKKITDELYGVFHETRLMMIDTFKKNGLNNLIAVEYTQIFLNRLIFFFFAADRGFISNSSSDSDMFYDSLNEQLTTKLTANSKRIYSYIVDDLFIPLNDGSDSKIFGFNGGLFSGNVPTSAYFNDLDDRRFLKDIENATRTKHFTNKQVKNIISQHEHLNPIIRNLLIMDSYDFKSDISVNILGHIFEQSVSVLEELLSGTNYSRKEEGVFYTPEYVTQYICNNTIIPYSHDPKFESFGSIRLMTNFIML